MANILIIDDDKNVRISAHFLLSRNGYDVQEIDHPSAALAHIQQHSTDLIMLDMNFNQDTTSGQEGLALLKQLIALDDPIPIVIMTAWPSVDLAVAAMKLGAKDFIEKPWDNTRLLQVIKQQLDIGQLKKKNRKLSQHNQELQQVGQLVWRSDPMASLFEQLDSLSSTDATLLLTGENGTGKSSIAQYIHNHSRRRHESFVSVNMGAIPDSLFESELFGHTKGAFTDANQDRIGRFELAEQGTLFLDEIGAIPITQQAKLLRVLETGEYERLGSSKTQLADIRLISASNTDFSQRIAEGNFRQDLYYRLNTIEIRVPSLIERRNDIIPLAEHFMMRHINKYGKSSLTLADDAHHTLLAYHWPGNIRELSHIIERAVLFTKGDKITAQSLSLNIESTASAIPQMPLIPLEQAERALITQALSQTQGNTSAAAQCLEISLSAMYRRMEKYDIKAK